MFNSTIYKAIMAKVKEKIAEAQYTYDEECTAIDKGYADAVMRAADIARQGKEVAEQKAIDSVIGKLL